MRNIPSGAWNGYVFFGALLDQEEKADQLFEKQKEALKRVEAEESTGKTVAFFSISLQTDWCRYARARIISPK